MKNIALKENYMAYVMYIFSLLLFATNGYYVAHISLASSQIVLMRTLLGGAFLTCLVLLKGGFDEQSVKAEAWPLWLGGTAMGLNWICLFEAYKQLNVSLATLIYYAGPILVLLFSPVLFNEKLTGRKVISVLMVGIGLICISGSIVVTGMNPMGLMAAMLSALFYATLIIFNKRITRTSGLQCAALEILAAFLVVVLYTLATAGMPQLKAGELPYIAILGLVNTGLAAFFYFSGLQKLSGQSIALISYLDPVAALVFSALLLNEVMTPIQMAGAVLIIGGAMFGELKSDKS